MIAAATVAVLAGATIVAVLMSRSSGATSRSPGSNTLVVADTTTGASSSDALSTAERYEGVYYASTSGTDIVCTRADAADQVTDELRKSESGPHPTISDVLVIDPVHLSMPPEVRERFEACETTGSGSSPTNF